MTSTLSGRQALWAFALGCIAVTAGVVLHLPMFVAASRMGFQMAGMPMDPGMVAGMALIVGGVLAAGYGLLPRRLAAPGTDAADVVICAPDDAPLGPQHWRLMLVLVIALVIDVMKPASLGFTIPGMVREYGVPQQTVSLVPFFALAGTVVGSVVWGLIADLYGRKASILLSAVMFIGTSICGAMPSLAWNIGMCFMMGAAAGGMLPVTYALLTEMIPSKHRGWCLVLVGGSGAIGGYLAASGFSALLQPMFGWRILWLLNLPSGLILVLLGGFIPESAKFLMARGRMDEARRVMQRFGAIARAAPAEIRQAGNASIAALTRTELLGNLAAMSLAAIAWGLVNFGLLLWVPAYFLAAGYSIGMTGKLLAQSALIAFPTVVVAALLYGFWSSKGALAATVAITLLGLAGMLFPVDGAAGLFLPMTLLIIGSNGIIAVLLPYAAESVPLRVRGRVTGWVAACTKGGGLAAQTLSISAAVPSMKVAVLMALVPALLALALVIRFGRETRGRDLRDLDLGTEQPCPT
jgi:putative MFS transporter